jgi:hypothetical protein
LLRLFTSAATSASVDIRWYVMGIAYETFILGKLISEGQRSSSFLQANRELH